MVLEKFCFCLPLKIGGLGVAWFGWIVSMGVTLLVLFDEKLHGPIRFASLACPVISATVNGLVILAISECKRLFLLPWLIANGITAVGAAVYLGMEYRPRVEIAVVVSIAFVLFIYIWIVIFSLYKEMRILRKNSLPVSTSAGTAQKV